jgi:hypothetical protein
MIALETSSSAACGFLAMAGMLSVGATAPQGLGNHPNQLQDGVEPTDSLVRASLP